MLVVKSVLPRNVAVIASVVPTGSFEVVNTAWPVDETFALPMYTPLLVVVALR